MEILYVMELLDDDKVKLQLLNFGGQVFSYLLNRFIIGQEVENLIDLSSKDVEMLPYSSINLVLNSSQSVMLLRGPFLSMGMA